MTFFLDSPVINTAIMTVQRLSASRTNQSNPMAESSMIVRMDAGRGQRRSRGQSGYDSVRGRL